MIRMTELCKAMLLHTLGWRLLLSIISYFADEEYSMNTILILIITIHLCLM